MEQEIVPACADRRDRHAAGRFAGDGQARPAAVGIGVETAALRRFHGVLDELVFKRRAERTDIVKGFRLCGRQECGDLRKAVLAVSAPDVGGGLRLEHAAHVAEHGEAKYRQRRLDQARDQEGQLPSVESRQPVPPFKPAALLHPLSASRTCLPASTGLLLVVMMKSPWLMPETAADLSSRASSCTVTRVAI